MSQITKTVRLGGASPDSIEDAVRAVLARAAETISDIIRFDVVSVRGRVDEAGVPTNFEVTLDLTFAVKDPLQHG
jgi:flavin-binding protein dodecin